jgi:uncharacterized Zn finger protein
MADLGDWLSRPALLEYVGSVIFQRGDEYFRTKAVSRLLDLGDKVTARVRGSYTYRVELSTDGEEFHYHCTCPHAAEGNFCKYCVAVGLAWLDSRARGFVPNASEDSNWDEVRRYLEKQPQSVLVNWLMEAAQQHDAVYRKLVTKTQRRRGMRDYGEI